jgi:hypothetical protein
MLLLIIAIIGFALSLAAHILTFLGVTFQVDLIIALAAMGIVGVGLPSAVRIGLPMDTPGQVQYLAKNAPRWMSITFLILLVYAFVLNPFFPDFVPSQVDTSAVLREHSGSGVIKTLRDLRVGSSISMAIYFGSIVNYYIALKLYPKSEGQAEQADQAK